MAFNEIILACLGVWLAGIGWAIKLLMTLNARSCVLNARLNLKEKQDDDRHKENLEKFESLFEQIRKLGLAGERQRR